jgi:hypothetical protein
MNSGIDINLILKYSKHLPSLLRKQYLDSLLQFDAVATQATTTVAADGKTPAIHHSIKRFYGTLLLVDISGFTNLSQNLSLDALKFHINSYFELILSEVDKHGGDVIKFAGDCLYIVWFPTSGVYIPIVHVFILYTVNSMMYLVILTVVVHCCSSRFR